MTSFDFFTRLGLFIKKDFLDDEFCAQCLAEARSVAAVPAEVFHKDASTGAIGHIVDEQIRKTEQLKVSKPTHFYVRERLQQVKPALEQHFNVSLTDFEKPLFYLYQKGSFFGPHVDCLKAPDTEEYVHAKKRSISVIAFLNRHADTPMSGHYGGGALTLYGLVDQPQWQEYGFPFWGEPGMLIAFRSDVMHEVKPVIHGERCTVVSWFV